MGNKYLITLCLFLSLAFLGEANAQELPHFLEKLTTEDGLSSNKINDIVQDDEGFIWIATSEGLNRFDGTEVVQYFHNASPNSLPHNYVHRLIKLPGNWLAIGTQKGLSFYNNKESVFRNFYYKLNNDLDEYNNTITRLEIDKRGNLWAASRNCIFIFDTARLLKKIIVSDVKLTDAQKGRLDLVRNIFPLSNGDVMVQFYYGWRIFSASTQTFKDINQSVFVNQPSFIKGLTEPLKTKNNEDIFIGKNIFKVYDHYFISIKSGEDSLLLFNEQGLQISSCYFPYNKYPYVSWSQSIVEMGLHGLLFLFHNYGFALIPVTWQGTQPVIHEASPLLFENYEFDKAICDRQGNWWLATGKEGIQKISPYKQFFKGAVLTNETTGKQIKYEVNCTCRYKNTLWIGTYGEGFFECDPLMEKQQQHYLTGTGDDVWSNFVWNIKQVNDDTLWIGTQNGLFWYSVRSKKNGRIKAYPGKPADLDSVAITTQFTDSHGLVWMGLGKSKGLCYFDSKNHFFKYYKPHSDQAYPLRYPLEIAEDKKSGLWFTNDASPALVYWNRTTDHFQAINLPLANGEESGNLYGICCENDSTLWLGAITTGLIKFITTTNSITLYDHENGLINTHITSIYEDLKKRVWLITQGGLSCLNQSTGSFSSYSLKEGLPIRAPSAEFYYDSIGKRLYTGGKGAAIYFEPENIHTDARLQKTIITALEVNGKSYPLSNQLKFNSTQNDITIHYTSVDLNNGPQTHYAYQLVGEDTGWIMAGNQRQINFSQLASGDYIFMVKSINSQGRWSNETASLHFYIQPPFTKTALFYILLLFATAGLFYGLYRFRIRQIMRTEQVRNEISRDLHDEVGATLTNISLGSLLAKQQLHNETALSYILERIQQDSQHVSESIREIIWSINPGIDTAGEAFPQMLRYASEILEAKNMVLKAEIAPGIENAKFSMQERRDLYLIFKEAINNLARHSGASQVSIDFLQVETNILAMIISDNGIGFSLSGLHMNNGLKNMNERAQRHKWKLDIKSEPGTGTVLTLKIQIA